jgi:hypothetical protein
MKLRTLFLLAVSMLALGGCQVMDTGFNKLGYQKIDEANAKIAQVEADAQRKQDELNSKLATENAKVLSTQTSQMQGAVDELFAANYAFTLNPNPDRNAIVVNYHVKGAADYLDLSPSAAAVAKHLVEVKQELDEAKTSIADLEKKYQTEKEKADALAKQKADAEAEKARIEKEKLDVEKEKNDKVAELQLVKDKEVKHVLDAQQKKLDDDNARKALVQKLMYWSGAIAVLALIAAVFAPVFKKESATIAGIMGAVTVALPFIEPWMVGIGLASILALFIGWMVMKHHKELSVREKALELESKVNKNLVNVIQDVKDKSKEVFESHLKPALEDWNTTVKQNPDGSIIKVADKEVMDAIDSKLIQSDRK